MTTLSLQQQQCRPFGIVPIQWSCFPKIAPSPPPHSTPSPSLPHPYPIAGHQSPYVQSPHCASDPSLQHPQRPPPHVYYQDVQDTSPTLEPHQQQTQFYWHKSSSKRPHPKLHQLPPNLAQRSQQFGYFQKPASLFPSDSIHYSLPVFHLSAERVMPRLEPIMRYKGPPTSLPPSLSNSFNSETGTEESPTPSSSTTSRGKELAKSIRLEDYDYAGPTDADTSDEDVDDGEYDPAETGSSRKASSLKKVMSHRSSDVADKESGKPYAKLVYEALKSASGCQMAVSGIYDYFKEHYPQFRNMKGRGWMNSIRYNLSMNEGFELVKRPDGDSGKGGLWQLTEEAREHGIKSTTRSRQSAMPRKRHTSTRCSLRSSRRQKQRHTQITTESKSYELEEQVENGTVYNHHSSYFDSQGPLTPPSHEYYAQSFKIVDDTSPDIGLHAHVAQDHSQFFTEQHVQSELYVSLEDAEEGFHTSWHGALPSPPIDYPSFESFQPEPTSIAAFDDGASEHQFILTRYGYASVPTTR